MQARTALFISHSSNDDAFVRDLRQALQPYGVDAWIDSRQLRPGGLLESEIMTAIENATAFTFVVTSEAHKSPWVFKELKHALKVQTQRDQRDFPVFALLLDDTELGAFEGYFDAEPLNARVTSDAGGVETAVNEVLIALKKRNRADVPPAPQPKAQPLEELVLELTYLKFHEQDGIRRASASARLVYQPATPGQREVASAESWRLIAPLGPIEAGELSWYLEHYAIWPSHYFSDRARKVEENLVKWGKLLHDAALPVAHTANVMQACPPSHFREGSLAEVAGSLE